MSDKTELLPTVYIDGENVSAKRATEIITEEWVDNEAAYCRQTVIDLSKALAAAIKLIHRPDSALRVALEEIVGLLQGHGQVAAVGALIVARQALADYKKHQLQNS